MCSLAFMWQLHAWDGGSCARPPRVKKRGAAAPLLRIEAAAAAPLQISLMAAATWKISVLLGLPSWKEIRLVPLVCLPSYMQ